MAPFSPPTPGTCSFSTFLRPSDDQKTLHKCAAETYPAPPPCATPLDQRSISRSCSIAFGCPKVSSPGLPIMETCSHSNITKASVDILPASRGKRLLIGRNFDILTIAPLFCVRRVLEFLMIAERSGFRYEKVSAQSLHSLNILTASLLNFTMIKCFLSEIRAHIGVSSSSSG